MVIFVKFVLILSIFFFLLFSITFLATFPKFMPDDGSFISSQLTIETNQFLSKEYVCTGSCVCESRYHNKGKERRTNRPVKYLSKSLKYIVLAFSPTVAFVSARNHFGQECEEQFKMSKEEENCDFETIRTEVEKCEFIDEEESSDFKNPKVNSFQIRPIGVVRSSWKSRKETPKYPGGDKTGAIIEIFEEYRLGMKDLDMFSYIYVFFIFNQLEDNEGPLLIVNPRRDPEDVGRGVFTTRSPMRPNSIGMSIVKIVKVEGKFIHIEGIDAMNGSPVVDIKAYYGDDIEVKEGEKIKTGWVKKEE